VLADGLGHLQHALLLEAQKKDLPTRPERRLQEDARLARAARQHHDAGRGARGGDRGEGLGLEVGRLAQLAVRLELNAERTHVCVCAACAFLLL